MDRDKYIEVTIIEPSEEIPTPDSSSVKGLSTIYEYNSTKVADLRMQRDVTISSSFKSNIERLPSFKERREPFDIDLLLRYYACNSSMEKSINNVLENANEKRHDYLNDPLVHQLSEGVDHGPLVELGAASKICDSLKESSSMSSMLSTFRFQNTLTKLRCLISRCNGKKLDEILQNNPSMKICKHCGVISCSKSFNTPVESKKSPPNVSYFLSADIFPDDAQCSNEDSKIRKEVKKFSPKSAKKNFEKSCDFQKPTANFIHKRPRKKNLSVKQESGVNKDTRRVETMIAERENDSKMTKKLSEKDDTESQNRINSHTTKLSPFKMKGSAPIAEPSQRTKINSNFEDKDPTNKNGTSANFPSNFSFDKRFDRLNCKQKLIDNVLSYKRNNLSVEQVVKDILYEGPKSKLDEHKAQNGTPASSLRNVNNKQNQSVDLPIDSTPFVNIMTYLARGRPELIDKGKEEFVSQPDERTCVHSRRSNDQHSFILHAGQTDNPRLNLDSSMCNESKLSDNQPKREAENTKIVSKHSLIDLTNLKYIETLKAFKQPGSSTRLIEEDSLENCIMPSETWMLSGESGTTVVSTSSAENMIREWVKSSPINNDKNVHKETEKGPVILKRSADGSDAKFQPLSSNGRSIQSTSDRERDFETHSLKKTWRSVPKNSFRQSMSYTLNSESPNNQLPNDETKSFRKAESVGGKKFFGKQSFGFFKSIRSKKIMRSKQNSLSRKSSTFSGNCFRGDRLKNVTRRFIYNEPSLKNAIGRTGRYNGTGNILSLYRKVLENTERMDWQGFQRFVEELHPNQKELWRDICKVIDNEARRLGDEGGTEVCIEINSVPSKTTKKGRTCRGKIMFEMDITLEEVERCLGRQLASTEKAQLDIHKRANEVIKARNDDVCDSEVVFNQAE